MGFIIAQQVITSLSDRSHARKRAASSRHMKIYVKMNDRKGNNSISLIDDLLASRVKTSLPKKILIGHPNNYTCNL